METLSQSISSLSVVLLGLAVVYFCYSAVPFLSESSTSLRSVPGPWLARFSRLWYLKEVSTGQFHHRNVALHKKYGPVVRIAPKQYSISDPSALKIIYGIGNGFAKSGWYDASSAPDGEWKDLFTDRNSARHSANRRVVAKLYSATALRGIEPDVEYCIREFVKQIERIAKSGSTMNLQFWLQCYAFDVISQITLGNTFGFLESGRDHTGIFDSLHGYLKYCALVGVEHELHRPLWWLLNKLPASGLVHIARFTAEQLAHGKKDLGAASEADLASRQNFLSQLFRLQKKDPQKFPDSAIFSTCITNIGAGSDTTSISLCSVLHNLMTHPLALEKLRQEVDAKYSELGSPEFLPFKDTQAMPYLQACIKEALRLHPATGLPLARVVPETGATISGTHFLGGSVVGINTWVMHQNTDIFGPDAQAFRPERWLDQSSEQLSVMERHWIPFGAGSRTCIGKNISLLEMNKLIPVLIKAFDFTAVDGEKARHENYWLVQQVDVLCKITMRRNDNQVGK
ncbi:hypothetical protein MKZ38_001617 [Zalerion maritima]|uniref:Cytochrome P450 n=1 Tax=Zalerion maritima TaxID=339359 RepID=A0AAD5WSZ5_9PEZI|nr:hypothetical protein MKZ38_001617 [Zalerion maritima]